jgi:hypothetical protein
MGGISRPISTEERIQHRLLNIGCWNVNGLKSKNFNKLEDQTFLNEITQHDIIGLIETHAAPTDIVNISGYQSVSVTRTKIKKARKHSGGIVVYIKNYLRPGAKIIEQTCSELVWLKLEKKYFHIGKDIYLAFTYITPSNSTYTRRAVLDVFSELEKGIARHSGDGNVVVMGDLNARTAIEQDYIARDCDTNLPLYNNYLPDMELPERNNQDRHKVDDQGKRLLDLCISTGMRILNGRTLGDLMGSLSCFKYNGASTVDYGLTDSEMVPKVMHFKVHDYLNDTSDHCKISIGLQVGLQYSQHHNNQHLDTNVSRNKYIWATDSQDKFRNTLQSTEFQNKITATSQLSTGSVNEILSAVNDIMHTAAEEALQYRPVHSRKRHHKKHKPVRKKWYDGECSDMKKILIHMGKKMKSDPFNASLRHNFFTKRKFYRNLLNQRRRKYRQQIMDMIHTASTKDPKEVWNLLGQLEEELSQSPNKSDNIPLDA